MKDPHQTSMVLKTRQAAHADGACASVFISSKLARTPASVVLAVQEVVSLILCNRAVVVLSLSPSLSLSLLSLPPSLLLLLLLLYWMIPRRPDKRQ